MPPAGAEPKLTGKGAETEGQEARPLVSVVIPAYNASRTIIKTIASAQNQIFDNIEIIVINDGSTDNTLDLLKDLARSEPRLHIISQDNSGVAAARNAGIHKARGKYIAPLDADDIWLPEHIEQQVQLLELHPRKPGLSFGLSDRTDENGRVIQRARGVAFVGPATRQLASGNPIGNGSAAVFRRDLAMEIGGYDTTLRARGGEGVEDWKFCFEMSIICEFSCTGSTSVHYADLPKSMSKNYLIMFKSSSLAIKESMNKRECYKRRLEIRLDKLAIIYSIKCIKNRNLTDAIQIVRNASENRAATFFLFVPISIFELSAAKLISFAR
ncbi:glycosyltransferase family 2 protein [Caulobacter sp. BP25]|uniref:glycosyltransferase family 2 protein n=1 Tax=Caulobacter sp. BP25 TaxID=2048900 RepID=UPI001374730B|nr:glycosyltransferase family 2 protein [Caulobacter sp. BP25]